MLREHLGKDVSSAFRGLDGESDHKHSSSASKQMRGMLIGWLTEDARTSQEPAESPDEFRLDPTKPVVFQVPPESQHPTMFDLGKAQSK